MKTKTQISCAVTAQLISTFVFAIRIVQSLFYQNRTFQASSHLQWLYSPVCVGPGRKSRRPVFSQRGSYKVKTAPKLTLNTSNQENHNRSTALEQSVINYQTLHIICCRVAIICEVQFHVYSEDVVSLCYSSQDSYFVFNSGIVKYSGILLK